MYKYYTTQRPPTPGAIPKGAVNVNDFGCKKKVEGNIEAYGWVEYNDKPSNAKDYELLSEAELKADKQLETIKEVKAKLKASNHTNIKVDFNIEGIAHITAKSKSNREFKMSVLENGNKKMGLKGSVKYEPKI